MKNLIIKSVFLITIVGLFGLTVNAQSNDDLYYSPSNDTYQTPDYTTSELDSEGNTIINNYYYEDKNDFNQFEDDFYYQSRFRRFNNNFAGFSYYAPVYTNTYFYTYNPYAWNTNIYYTPYYSRNWWNRGVTVNVGWNRGFNNYNPFGFNNYNPYSFSPYAAYTNYYNPFGYNSYSPYAYNAYGAGYDPCIGSGAYVNNTYNSDNYYENTYYGTVPSRTNTNNNATPAAAINRGNQTTYDTYRPTSNYNNTSDNNVRNNNSSSMPVYGTPSKSVTRPATSNANPSKPTYSAPKSVTKPIYSTPKSTTKPSYSTPNNTVRPSYSAPKSNTKPNYSKPSYSKPAQQSRPSYSAPKTNRSNNSIKSTRPRRNNSFNKSSRPRSNSSKGFNSRRSNSSTKSLRTKRG